LLLFFEVSGFGCPRFAFKATQGKQPSRWRRNDQFDLKKKLMNVQHRIRLRRIQHRIRNFCQFKKMLNNTRRKYRAGAGAAGTIILCDRIDQSKFDSAAFDKLRPRARRGERVAGFDSLPLNEMDKAQRHQYWTFDVRCSMFDVQSFYSSNFVINLLPRMNLFFQA